MISKRLPPIVFLLCIFCFGLNALAQQVPEFDLRLVPIVDGNFETSFGRDVRKFGELPMVKSARSLGVDPAKPKNPFVQLASAEGSVFYLFYNSVLNVPPNNYLIQRIKKIDTRFLGNGKEEVATTYLVEAMKTRDGQLKKPDQHYGHFSLRDGCVRRVISKEFEIGIGSIPDRAEPGPWPFANDSLFRVLQPYQADAQLHSKVSFIQSVRWTMRLEFDQHGNYDFQIPELSIVARLQVPPTVAIPVAEPAGMDIVLTAGEGIDGLAVGKSALADVDKRLGRAPQVSRFEKATNHIYDGITCNINNAGRLNTVFTTLGFAGRTAKGIRHGSTLVDVTRLYGVSPHKIQGGFLAYPKQGIYFHLDPQERVKKIVVGAAR